MLVAYLNIFYMADSSIFDTILLYFILLTNRHESISVVMARRRSR